VQVVPTHPGDGLFATISCADRPSSHYWSVHMTSGHRSRHSDAGIARSSRRIGHRWTTSSNLEDSARHRCKFQTPRSPQRMNRKSCRPACWHRISPACRIGALYNCIHPAYRVRHRPVQVWMPLELHPPYVEHGSNYTWKIADWSCLSFHRVNTPGTMFPDSGPANIKFQRSRLMAHLARPASTSEWPVIRSKSQ
jgi:hypothetical protein